MSQLPNLIAHLAPVAERYITLLRVHPTKRYNYAKRNFYDLPVIEINQHSEKCKNGDSWLYFSVPTTASLSALLPQDRLYVGSQTQDRMFRGDGLNGQNFHHAEMRAGKGSDTPIAFLNEDRQIDIYRVASNKIAALVSSNPALEKLRVLAELPRTPRQHLGWWYEQYVLLSEPNQWRWNIATAYKPLVNLFA